MTTNMQLSQGDKEMIGFGVAALLDRRKQLCPWPFTIEQTEKLFITENVWRARQQIVDLNPNYDDLFYKGSVQKISVQNVVVNRELDILIRCSARFWCGQSNEKLPAVTHAPHYPEFHQWCVEAAKVQAMNEHVGRIITKVLNKATTYRQIHKALPETLSALTSHYASEKRKNSWNYRNAIHKLGNVTAELGSTKVNRAREMPQELKETLAGHRHHVEQTMAMAVLLPDHDGTGHGQPFDATWISGSLMK